MAFLDDIKTPTLLLDERKCRANIRSMADKARSRGCVFRPHFKTHQSRAIGAWFRAVGVDRITVSSLSMARYFARDGWRDITVAFPVNVREIPAVNELARRIRLNLLVADPGAIAFLNRRLEHRCGFFVKVDTGYHRTGIRAGDRAGLRRLLGLVRNPRLEFRGFLTHAGHTYAAGSAAEILRIHGQTVRQLAGLKRRFSAAYPELIVSLGDTPGCSLAEDFRGVDEIRPGNFVFYDVMQARLGACRPAQIAVCLACPVVARDHRRRELLVYGGAVHLSKESLAGRDGRRIYGLAVALGERAWSDPLPGWRVTHLSQEHGIVRTDARGFERFRVGDLIGILPVHSCLTADLMGEYRTTQGGRIERLSR